MNGIAQKRKLTAADITPDIKTAVNAVLLARIYAKVKRADVDKIERAVLAEAPLTNGLEVEHGLPARMITEPKETYLCTDKEILANYYAEVNKHERQTGIKPDTMPDDCDPACCAEEVLRTAQHLLIKAAEPVFDATLYQLLCAGLYKYREYINLLCGLVVNLPDFKNPLKEA
ncbi:MAG: hypothetical protein WC554_01025 [Clostridia bacterium]|jgi:hypothetical protein